MYSKVPVLIEIRPLHKIKENNFLWNKTIYIINYFNKFQTMADPQQTETKEEYIINRFASNFFLKQKSALDKFRKSIETSETSV